MFKLFDLITIDIKQIILPIIYIVIGIIVYGFTRKIINKAIKVDKTSLKTHQKQRAQTLKILVLNIIKYVIVIIVILAILATFNINVRSIVAGLGITTAIIGLAFQDLAKDLIAGFSIITENQYEVGDTIEIDGFVGEVVFLGLKTTQIRDYKGATKIIANHNMDKLINYSLHNSLAVVDVMVDYQHNPEDIEKILNDLGKDLEGSIPDVTGKLEVWGIDDFGEAGMKYRMVMETKPTKNFSVERLLRKKIKERFEEKNIKIPYDQIEVHNGK